MDDDKAGTEQCLHRSLAEDVVKPETRQGRPSSRRTVLNAWPEGSLHGEQTDPLNLKGQRVAQACTGQSSLTAANSTSWVSQQNRVWRALDLKSAGLTLSPRPVGVRVHTEGRTIARKRPKP